MTKYYCPMPWHGGFFTPTRQSVCCIHGGQDSVSPLEFIKSDHVKKLKQSLISGDLDRYCEACRTKEQQGLVSLKEIFENTLSHHGVNFCHDPEVESKPERIEVRFSNLCNFQCRMCGPRDSNLIGKEIKLNPEMQQFFEKYDLGLVTAEERFFDEIVQLLPGLKGIYFTGGEPMIHKQVLKLIDVMIEQGANERVELAMTTNGSAINPYITNQLEQFRRTQLTVSIDGVGAAGEYQRYGSEWSKVAENVETLGELSRSITSIDKICWLAIHSAISAYTVLDVDSLMEYYVDLYHRYNFTINVTIINNFNLNPNVLPDHIRPYARERLKKAIEILKPISHEKYISCIIDQFTRLVEILAKPLENKRHYNEFVTLTRVMDRVRNQDFEKTFGLPLEID